MNGALQSAVLYCAMTAAVYSDVLCYGLCCVQCCDV
jgi:hypothetical protein